MTNHTSDVRRTYRYRLMPTRAQDEALRGILYLLRELYNGALQERRDAYRKLGKMITVYDQMAELPEVKQVRPDLAVVYAQVLQDVIGRLDRAYRAFFRRVKAGEKPGFPRFKGRGRYNTFTFPQAGKRSGGGVAIIAGGKRVRIHGIGNVKIKIHREMEGRIKTASVTLSGDGNWYIAFSCDDVPAKSLQMTGKSVGIDLGITTFAALSDGTMVENPRVYQVAQRKLATAQRCVSRRKRGSKRRRKAVRILAKQHDRVRRTRLDFHHKVTSDLVKKYDAIAVEDLNIKGLARGFLSKQVSDAAWGQFTRILSYKAESAGREFVKVDPCGTSQECSGCGKTVRKGLHVRVHRCPHCGLVLNRDTNAAINVERRGQRLRGGESGKLLDEPRSLFPANAGIGVVTDSMSASICGKMEKI